MYAVIVSGGKQHRVKEGETLKLEKLEVETGVRNSAGRSGSTLRYSIFAGPQDAIKQHAKIIR